MSDIVRSYHDLLVWQLGMELTELIYKITAGFPSTEKYGLTSQMRRAAASIPANIAEGHGRDSIKEYLHHLSIAFGSLCEVETFVQLASRLGFATNSHLDDLLQKVHQEGRMLRGLQKSLRKKLEQSKKAKTHKNSQPELPSP